MLKLFGTRGCNVTNAVVTERDFWGGRRSVIRRACVKSVSTQTIRVASGVVMTLVTWQPGALNTLGAGTALLVAATSRLDVCQLPLGLAVFRRGERFAKQHGRLKRSG